MKKLIGFILTLVLCVTIAACADHKCPSVTIGQPVFKAKILEMNGDTVLVEPLEGEIVRNSSDRISFSKKDLEQIGAVVGQVVEITYDGNIMESYPAQIHASKWEIVYDLRPLEYTEVWLDKETAEKCDNDIFDHIVITEIYSNCFFAENAIPLPTRITVSGAGETSNRAAAS